MIDASTAQFIGFVGFPIFLNLWFMYRMEPLIKTNNEVLAVVVEHLQKKK